MTDNNATATIIEKATFGAGCFWGVEAAYRQIKGVKTTAVGFMVGSRDKPSYEDVCYRGTGHAEVVEVEYDPGQVSYEDLLDVFWENHDPTQLNRQGPDVGDQYRTAIFFHSPVQEAAAIASKKRRDQSGAYRRPIVTASDRPQCSGGPRTTTSSTWRSAASPPPTSKNGSSDRCALKYVGNVSQRFLILADVAHLPSKLVRVLNPQRYLG